MASPAIRPRLLVTTVSETSADWAGVPATVV